MTKNGTGKERRGTAVGNGEVVSTGSRRQFSKAYKRRILAEAEAIMAKGEAEADPLLVDASPATAYGVGNWYLYNGDPARAVEIFSKIVDGDSEARAPAAPTASGAIPRSDAPHTGMSTEATLRMPRMPT